MSTGTVLPGGASGVNKDVAAWLSTFWPDTYSVAVNPQNGSEVWIIRHNGTIERRPHTVSSTPIATPFPGNVNFNADRTMPTVRKLLAKFEFTGRVHGVHAELLLCVWMIALFLRGLIASKPLLLITGPVGGGKTVLGRLIGRALLGPRFSVSRVPPNEKDYAALMSSRPYVVLDNVETMPRWMPDDLATQVTGGSIPLRQLYTDTTLLDALLNAYVAITCATPEWLSSYLLDRSLVITVGKPPIRVPEPQLDAFVDVNRAQILSECLTVARLALMKIAAHEPSVEIDFRLSDFACYGGVVAEVIGGASGKKTFQDALGAMAGQRLAVAEDSDAVLAALVAVAKLEPKPMTSGALINALSNQMSNTQAAWSAIGNPTQLGKTLAGLRTRATGIVDITRTTVHGRAMYKVSLPGKVGWGAASTSSSEKEDPGSTPPHPAPFQRQASAARICSWCGQGIAVGEPATVDTEGGLVECATCTTRSAS